ncbi:hypothetical protein FB451DRAFT_1372036 [Mycena latifolia]|nr:hypothetical protein FB451DRAFT_1372036 [Mycena latifolia]
MSRNKGSLFSRGVRPKINMKRGEVSSGGSEKQSMSLQQRLVCTYTPIGNNQWLKKMVDMQISEIGRAKMTSWTFPPSLAQIPLNANCDANSNMPRHLPADAHARLVTVTLLLLLPPKTNCFHRKSVSAQNHEPRTECSVKTPPHVEMDGGGVNRNFDLTPVHVSARWPPLFPLPGPRISFDLPVFLLGVLAPSLETRNTHLGPSKRGASASRILLAFSPPMCIIQDASAVALHRFDRERRYEVFRAHAGGHDPGAGGRCLRSSSYAKPRPKRPVLVGIVQSALTGHSIRGRRSQLALLGGRRLHSTRYSQGCLFAEVACPR